MKTIQALLFALAATAILFFSASLSLAQPCIPKDQIPSNLAPEVRLEIERLYSEDHEARAHGASMLGKMGATAYSSIPFLICLLEEPEDACAGQSCGGDHHGHAHSPSEEALKALIGFGEVSVDPLIKACSQQDVETRRKALRALGEMKQRRAIPCMAVSLKHDNTNVRMLAAWGLGQMGEPALKPLLAELEDKGSPGRSDAAFALGKINQPQAIGPLIAALKETDPELRKESAKALSRITGQDFGESAAEWQKWWRQNKSK
jgi:hypothetical protein